ncbi:hypothetical protein A2Z22_03445 [Candidatus Woesebacteria bacterium RBG_16_34_12]|uniref:Peptidyl-tRNA hydrolase n=1 Tax=Candidatus Woesebacteria bacterium RBG_16_34_12 TaxID=1802480 RepID=A0A1F7XCJ7_9BACT|nr:MAG: hypothetical protein A2Z22_03445 [Candidatus Woesebacteria bacterium RBG_16_34_12]
MKLIIGIGNPGEKYKKTRHNVGFLVVDSLWSLVSRSSGWRLERKFQAEVCRPESKDLILAKPQTMMNESGIAVKKLVDFYKVKLDELYVIHDDLDVELGEYKIQFGTGPKVHYGIQSINQALGTLRLRSGQASDYWRVRVGIENRKVEQVGQVDKVVKTKRVTGEPSFAKASKGKEYVLQDFTFEEQKIVDGVIKKVVGELLNRVAGS